MASQGLSRKRPAPGTSPVQYQSSYAPPSGLGSYGGLDPQLSNDQFLQFGYQPQTDNSQTPHIDNSIPKQPDYISDVTKASNQLARRPANQVVARDRGRAESSDLQRMKQEDGQQLQSALSDDIGELKQKAQVAKREAQSKRKQIPPFVQKLAR